MKSPLQNIVATFSRGKTQGQDNPTFENDDSNKKTNEAEKEDGQENVNISMDKPQREQWSNPTEFLLSCIAMSVGLGNIWRFPFTAYNNGGGAFLIPYIIVLLLIGKPLYYMELCMGQFSSYGSVKVWALVPGLKGIGYGQAIATWSVVTYYVSLMALTVFYFVVSFFSPLPWATCDQRQHCIDHTTNHSAIDIATTKSASEIYYEEVVLKRHKNGLDDGIDAPEWRLTLCLLISWIILFFVLVKGVKSAGKSAYFTALFPYVVLFILLGKGVSLDGAFNGIKYFILPQWEKLLEPQVWFEAVGQSFFSLSVGFGSITMFSSYNDFRHNVYRDALIISIIDTLTSLLAGFTIFAILGHLAFELDVDVDQVLKDGGSGLAFISYPDVIARFDWVPQLFAVLFFLMLFTLGVGSASALTGCIITIICDEFPHFKKYVVTLVVCILGFLLGLFYVTPQGQYILTIVDSYGGTFIIYILAFLEVIAVQWIYGMKNFIIDIEFMLGRKTNLYWRLCWAVIIPTFLFVILVYTLAAHQPLKLGAYVFGAGARVFGSLLTLLALSCIPLLFFIKFRKIRQNLFGSVLETVKLCFQASPKWCPKEVNELKNYQEFVALRKKANTLDMNEYFDVNGELEARPWLRAKLMFTSMWKLIKYIFWED